MKKLVRVKTAAEMLKTHPIKLAVEGWYMRWDEVANNCYKAEAKDIYGRIVGKDRGDPEVLQREIEEIIRKDFSNL